MLEYTCKLYGYHICLFCGNKMKSKWDHEYEYFTCECEDFKTQKRIEGEIQELERSMPQRNYYKISQEKIIDIPHVINIKKQK